MAYYLVEDSRAKTKNMKQVKILVINNDKELVELVSQMLWVKYY